MVQQLGTAKSSWSEEKLDAKAGAQDGRRDLEKLAERQDQTVSAIVLGLAFVAAVVAFFWLRAHLHV
jgi:hypothetical protein